MNGNSQNHSNQISHSDDPELQKTQMVDDWMRKFAGQTAPPQNLSAPGFLLFKARLIEKQSAAARAVQPIVRMQIASAVIFALAIGWLLLKSQTPIGSLMKETFLSLLSVAPLIILGVTSALSICLAFAYLLRETKELKNNKTQKE